jgi:hypothetical protein
MGDTGDMAGMDMSTPMMPTWVRLVWAGALAVALLMHLTHVYRMPGQHRWWVLGHVAMAAAMIPMYLPELLGGADFSPLGLPLFACAAFVAAAVGVAMRYRENVLNPLWVMLAIDLAIMAYMWLPATNRSHTLDGVLVTYFLYQIVAWTFGIWDRVPVLERSAPGGRHSPRPPPTVAVVGLTVHTGLTARAILAVMAASMGFMLVAM